MIFITRRWKLYSNEKQVRSTLRFFRANYRKSVRHRYVWNKAALERWIARMLFVLLRSLCCILCEFYPDYRHFRCLRIRSLPWTFAFHLNEVVIQKSTCFRITGSINGQGIVVLLFPFICDWIVNTDNPEVAVRDVEIIWALFLVL